MKKIYQFLLLALAVPFLCACDDDRDSNPVLQTPATFELNMPAYAANNVYELSQCETLELTCSQPDYGFPVATTYSVQLSLDVDAETPAYTELISTYNTARMNVDAKEFANAFNEQWDERHSGQALPQTATPVLVRLLAHPTSQTDLVSYSNAITLNVTSYQPPVTVSLPTEMYLPGDSGATPATSWNAGEFYKLFAADQDNAKGYFFGIIYFGAGAEFKVVPENMWGNDKGYGQLAEIDDQANAGLSAAGDGDGANIKVANAGWYTVAIETKIRGEEVQYTLHVLPAELYVFGSTNGGTWQFDDAWKFSVPATADGDFVSPTLTAGGELRVSVKTTVDWWQTEISLKGGTEIVSRDKNMPNSWEETFGSDYSVQPSAGQTVHFNFLSGTGSVQ